MLDVRTHRRNVIDLTPEFRPGFATRGLRFLSPGVAAQGHGSDCQSVDAPWDHRQSSPAQLNTHASHPEVAVEQPEPSSARRRTGALGARQLRELSADDVDRWLADKSKVLGTRSLLAIHSILRRSVTRAQARDRVKRNVALLCETPKGRDGRPSKSLTLDQAAAVLAASEGTPMHAYVVLSLLTGARTEELRALRWDHVVAYDDTRQAWVPVSIAGWDHDRFAIYVWRSVRTGGDTKTKKSRRTLALPKRCVAALRGHYDAAAAAARRGSRIVFTTSGGTPLDRHSALRAFRKVIGAAGLTPGEWTPREMRHSFVSLLSDAGVPLENIARLVGHVDTTTTETVYRKQIRPVVLDGATAMDRIFPEDEKP
jgi:integrase